MTKKLVIGNLIALSCVMLLYLIPFFSGYGWNAYYPRTPQVTGASDQHSRPANGEVTIESFGTGVIEVGLSARIAEFAKKLNVPFWNPHQGLGQPFVAMGEGNPYWPPRVIRALLPYSLENLITLLVLPLSAFAMYSLLRLLTASATASITGSCIWIAGGSLSMHLARASLFDQVASLPLLFYGVVFAMKRQTHFSLIIGALATACFTISGFPQIAVVGLGAASVYVVSTWFGKDSFSRYRSISIGFAAIVLGLALAAFYLGPLLGTVLTAWEPRGKDHGFLPMPLVNLASFFFPILSGQPLNNWMPGSYPNVTDWNNLYGHSSNLVAILICFGVAASREMPRETRATFFCFLGTGLALYLKYISLPPFSFFNYLPLIGTITPKHMNGVTAFMFTVAAALSVDYLRKRHLRFGVIAAFLLLITASTLLVYSLYLVRNQGTYNWPLAMASVGITALLFAGSLGLTVILAHSERLESWRVTCVLTCILSAEGVAYLLLGNSSVFFLVGRGAIVITLFLAAVLTTTKYARFGFGFIAATVIGYGALITQPTYGLPARVNLLRIEPYMSFLKRLDTDNYRTFGINADFSSIASIDDISTAGPFAPQSFKAFVDLVSNDEMRNFYGSAAKFWLDHGNTSAPHFTIDQYQAMQPLFDWIGVKYIVLAKKDFTLERRPDYSALSKSPSTLKTVYEDSYVTILESSRAKPKVEFYKSLKSYQSEADQAAILRSRPSTIEHWAFIPSGYLPNTGIDNGPPSIAIIESKGPNHLRVSVSASMAGLLEIKNAFSNGWTATINRSPTEILPVSGILQGIFIPSAGHYDVELSYRPPGILAGGIVSASAFLVLIGLFATRRRTLSQKLPEDLRCH
jgi:hypothetical protein